jgi:hypothetical protein
MNSFIRLSEAAGRTMRKETGRTKERSVTCKQKFFKIKLNYKIR